MPELHHVLPIVLQQVHALLLAQQLMLLEVLRESGERVVRTRVPSSPSRPHTPHPDLVFPPHAHRVRHEVAPVLLQDVVLLLGQGAQLARAALQVRVQAAQALPAPRGRLLCSAGGGERRGTERRHQAAPRNTGTIKSVRGQPRPTPSPPRRRPGPSSCSPVGPGIGPGWWLHPVSTKWEKTQAW